MTAPVDDAFVAEVRAALDVRVREIIDEAGGDSWQRLAHRALADRIKALVAAWCGAAGSAHAGSPKLLDHAVTLAGRLQRSREPSGLFSGGDNFDSPPDSAFSVNDLADAALLLRRANQASADPADDPARGTARPVTDDPTTDRHPHQTATDPAAGPAQRTGRPATDNPTADTADRHPHQTATDSADDPTRRTAQPATGWPATGQAATDATGGAAARRLAEVLEDLLNAAEPALVKGGVHTPNHRWELSAALARLHRLTPRPALADRVAQWLAEGVDIDDGLYSERSANYAAHVSNPSLLTIAEVFDRPDLVDAVERNLDATLALLLPDGSVETVLSRRQDQRWPIPLAAYLLPLRRVALLRGRGDLAWAAGVALAQGVDSSADAAAQLLLDPGIARPLPAPVEPGSRRQRVFGRAGLLMDHRPALTTVVFGGSDYARHGRVRSGLANSPTFLRVFAGAAVLESVRLSRTFFGLGPFRGDGLAVRHGAGGETIATLTETVAASYYQPLAAADRVGDGSYRLGDEGRFSAAMDFGRRPRDEVALSTTIQVRLGADGVRLAVDVGGAAVDWALELAFRPGGTLTGARPLGGQRWQLDLGPGGNSSPGDKSGFGEPATARYRVGEDVLSVTVSEATDGRGGPLRAAGTGPAYHPGEDYDFLGGTDAASGMLLYVSGQSPTRALIDIRKC